MAKKKVVYQVTKTTYQYIEVEAGEEAECIKELNKDFERFKKQEQTSRIKCTSLDSLFEAEGFELKDPFGLNSEEIYLKKERENLIQKEIHLALNALTPRQKEMVIMIYFEDKTQDEVALYFNISKQAVSNAMKRIYATLKKILEKNENLFF